MIGGRRLNKSYLPPELALYAWVLTGSLSKAARLLENQGFKNFYQNKPMTPMGVMYCAKRSKEYPYYKDANLSNPDMEALETKFRAMLPVEKAKYIQLRDDYFRKYGNPAETP